jgi:hypothetical protein
LAWFKRGNLRASIVAWRRAGWVAPRRWGAAEPAARRPTAQTAQTRHSLQRSRLLGSGAVEEALRTEAAGRPMAAAPHRAAAVAEGVLRVAAAAARAARNLSRPLPQICSTAPVTAGGPPQRGLRTTAVNAAVGQGGMGGRGLDLGCQLSTVNLRGTRRPTPAKLGHEARILVVHRHKAAGGRPAGAAGVEERTLGGSVAPSGGVNTLVVLLECAVDLPSLRPHASGSGGGGGMCSHPPRSLAPSQARASASPSV